MIKETDKRILDALCCAINGRTVGWGQELDEEQWLELCGAADKHNILPLVADALPRELKAMSAGFARTTREKVLHQASRTAELILLLEYLREKHLHPLVVKGMICRSLYPEPEHRPSTDEDLLVDPAEFPQVHEALLAYGLELVKPEKDLRASFEVSYQDPERHLYVEVHKALFTQQIPYLNRMNAYFRGTHERAIRERICGVPVRTLCENDHLLYLLLHALKHFLHSGVGIRQVCDIGLYSERNGARINWQRLKRQLTEVNALDFARAIFRIADERLLPDSRLREYLADWSLESVDAEAMLGDIMDGGLYGTATMSRTHSAPMTLNAATKQRSNSKKAVLHTVFPSRESMESRYRYLEKAPYLLPAAWVQRLGRYVVELLRGDRQTNSALESIRVGSERIRLLEQYHIIDDKK